VVATPQYLPPAQRVLASAPAGQMPLWGITLTHPLFSPIDHAFRLVNRPAAMDLTHEDDLVYTYSPAWFELTLPKLDGAGQQEAQLSVQNVDRMIVDELELAAADPSQRIEVTLRLFLEEDPEAGPQNVPLTLSFSRVQATSAAVTGVAGRPDILNRPFPMEVYRIDRWPGLDR
jgi:hypothetical protein